MKSIALAVAVQLLFYLVKGNDVQDGGKRVVCFYEPWLNDNISRLLPEDIDASLCTHLMAFRSQISDETGQMEFVRNDPYAEKDDIDRVLKLKENNPELKVLPNLKLYCSNPSISTKSRWSSLINNIIEFLKLHRFDGVRINIFEDCIGELLCELRSEFDKQGLILTTTLPFEYVVEVEQDLYNKSRCYHFFIDSSVFSNIRDSNVTAIISPLASVKSFVDVHLAKGFPADKLVVTIPAFGMIANLKNLNETGIGAELVKSGHSYLDAIKYNEMVKKINDPSEQWTIRRDEASNSPYGFNIRGQWASYDDTTSVATKAQYVVENKLGGASIMFLDLDDHKGIGGEGTFPLTRKLHDIVIGGKENKTHSSGQ